MRGIAVAHPAGMIHPLPKTLSNGLQFAALALCACEAGDNSSPSTERGPIAQPMPTLPAVKTVTGPLDGKFAGEDAAAFYGNLVFKDAKQEGGTPASQRVLLPGDRIQINKATSKTQFVELQIYLNPNNTFLVLYREADDAKATAELPYTLAAAHTGEYSVEGTILTLVGIGTVSTGETTTTRYGDTFRAINLNFSGDLAPTLKDERVKLTALATTQTPDAALTDLNKDADAIANTKEAAVKKLEADIEAAKKIIEQANAALPKAKGEAEKARADADKIKAAVEKAKADAEAEAEAARRPTRGDNAASGRNEDAGNDNQ